jgi:hypothetical protein
MTSPRPTLARAAVISRARSLTFVSRADAMLHELTADALLAE